MYQLIKNSNSIKRSADGAFIPADPANSDYAAYLKWAAEGNTPEPAPIDPPPTQFELDQRRYQKRAEVQSKLIAWMAADNMSRVRNGEWMVQDLTALLADPALSAANQFMSTLSFELAAQAIQSSTNELLTQEIKTKWINKLQEHFYLENT